MDIERKQDATPVATEAKREWIAPEICEYDADLLTQSTFTPGGVDGGMYS